jgi:hypothetical protein
MHLLSNVCRRNVANNRENPMTGLACLAILAAVLGWTIKYSRATSVDLRKEMLRDDRQPYPVERLTDWELRLGRYLAQEQLRASEHRAERRMASYRAAVAFDERATVQPLVRPKLPK